MVLAEELGADLLIIHEVRGRRLILFTGTLDVLAAGAERGLLDLRSAVDRLRQTSFHVTQHVLNDLTHRNTGWSLLLTSD
jgi:predicted nucleic acid-binding protein